MQLPLEHVLHPHDTKKRSVIHLTFSDFEKLREQNKAREKEREEERKRTFYPETQARYLAFRGLSLTLSENVKLRLSLPEREFLLKICREPFHFPMIIVWWLIGCDYFLGWFNPKYRLPDYLWKKNLLGERDGEVHRRLLDDAVRAFRQPTYIDWQQCLPTLHFFHGARYETLLLLIYCSLRGGSFGGYGPFEPEAFNYPLSKSQSLRIVAKEPLDEEGKECLRGLIEEDRHRFCWP